MKVPVYNSQTQMATPQGASRLTTQASPGALSQDSRALASFGEELANQSMDLYSRMLTEKRQTELNEAEVNLATQLADLELQTQSESPSVVMGKGPKSFKSRAQLLVSKLAIGLDDSVVSKRFKNRSLATLTNASITVNKEARRRQIGAAFNSEMKKVRQAQDVLSRPASPEYAAQQADARLYLFGIDGAGQKSSASVFENMAARGLIGPDKVFEYESGTKATIQENTVRTILLNAKQTGNTTVIDKLVNNLLDGKAYPDIAPGKSITLANQALTTSIAMQNEAESQDRATSTAAQKAETQRVKQNERELLAQLIDFQDTGNNKPSLADISDKLKDGDINTSIAKIVSDALTDDSDIPEDRAATFGILQRARAAETEEDITAVRNAALQLVENNKGVKVSTLSSVLQILDTAGAARTSSAAAKELRDLRQYDKLINTRFARDEEGFQFTIAGQTTPEDAAKDQRFFDAKVKYYELATSPNFTPKEAFELLRDQITEGEERELPFVGLTSRFMDTYFPLIDGPGNINFVLTQPAMAEAQAAINGNDDISQFEKAADLEQLILLRKYYEETRIQPAAPTTPDNSIENSGTN